LPADQAALLVWLTDHGLGGNEPWLAADPGRSAALPALIERIAGSPLGAWSETLPSDLAQLGGVAPGDPVLLSPEAARLAPLCVSRDGDTALEFRFRWPDGRSCGLDEALYLPRREGFAAHASLVLCGGVFSAVVGEPPGQLLHRVRESGGLLLRPAERLALLRRLGAGFPHLRDTLRAHTRVHAAAPAVTLDLGADDRLHHRLFGRARAPPHGGVRARVGRAPCGSDLLRYGGHPPVARRGAARLSAAPRRGERHRLVRGVRRVGGGGPGAHRRRPRDAPRRHHPLRQALRRLGRPRAVRAPRRGGGAARGPRRRSGHGASAPDALAARGRAARD